MSAFESDGTFFPSSEWRTERRMKHAHVVSDGGNMIIIDWDEDKDQPDVRADVTENIADATRRSTSGKMTSMSYPCVWLRDFCHCPECFHAASETKRTNLQDIDLEIAAEDTSVREEGKELRVRWSDGHESMYPAAWLWCNKFRDTAPDPFIDLPQDIWGADSISTRLREFQYGDLMTSDSTLCEFMRELKVLGLTLIKNAPRELATMTSLGQRFGYLKDTNFGLVSEVLAPPDPAKPDYTAGNLYFHTDLSYYMQQPSIQFLLCIKQFEGVGGDSTLVDGFNVANQLRRLDPEAFRALSTHDVEFYQKGNKGSGKYFQLARNKIIRLDSNGALQQVCYSNHSRTSILRMLPEEVTHFYKAMRLFIDLLYHEKNVFNYKMNPGDIIVFNNFRVLHGRKGFEMKEGSERHLATCYMDWDLLYSRMRVIAEEAGENGL